MVREGGREGGGFCERGVWGVRWDWKVDGVLLWSDVFYF